jgi:MYXO-CTERM domain-containing protein
MIAVVLLGAAVVLCAVETVRAQALVPAALGLVAAALLFALR